MVDDADRSPIRSWYEFVFAGRGWSTTAGPTRIVITRLLGWGWRICTSPLFAREGCQRRDLVDNKIDGPCKIRNR